MRRATSTKRDRGHCVSVRCRAGDLLAAPYVKRSTELHDGFGKDFLHGVAYCGFTKLFSNVHSGKRPCLNIVFS